MYLGVDIGGTKTLVAALDENGVIIERAKFPTPPDYDEFLKQLTATLAGFSPHDYLAGGLAMPVTVFDRALGVGVRYSNLPWQNVSIHSDVERIAGCPIVVENDAKLGGLSEALMLKDKYHRVLYVTVSTGIGISLVVNAKIDTNIGDSGGRAMMFEHDGKIVPWESFASGRAIVERYGKRAVDITDEDTWRHITRDLSLGLLEMIAMFQPDVIVIGGSVGTYFDRYGKFLSEDLQTYHLPLVPIPPVVGAQRAEEAVVYGCYDLAKETYGTVTR